MTKMKKKKMNSKLRKRIMRTASALTMAMAVGVAAIPVENLGSVQASGDSAKIEDLYSAYSTAVNEELKNGNTTTYTDDYVAKKANPTGTSVTTQIISSDGESIDNQFEVIDGVITKYVGTSNDVDIANEKLYYGYFFLTGADYDAFKTDVANNDFYLAFNTKNAELDGTTYTSIIVKDADGNNSVTIDIPKMFTEEAPIFSIGDVGKDESTFTASVTGATTYRYRGNNTSYYSYEDVFKSDETIQKYNDYANERTTTSSSYNSEVESLITSALNAQSENDITKAADLKTEAENLKTTLSGLQSDDNRLKVTISELSEDYAFMNKTICARIYYNNGDTSGNKVEFALTGFNLEQLKNEANGGATVYIPRWVGSQSLYDTDKSDTRSKWVDNNGRIIKGSVSVTAIGNEAFKNSTVNSVVLSDNITYIGDSAFEDCNSLNSITLDPTRCTTIGNRAFYNCTIREIAFTGTGSKLSEIGAEAFYNCANLSSVTFPNSITKIDMGAFVNSGLSTFKFDENNNSNIEIRPFAFYNCLNLNSIDNPEEWFPKTKSVTIGFGAFALQSNNTGGNMRNFVFPSTMNAIIVDSSDELTIKDKKYGAYDRILENRSGLSSVTFPSNMRGDIPEGTIWGCTELDNIILGAISYDDNAGSKISYENGEASLIFRDIENPSFYVGGPGYNRNTTTKSDPRKATVELTTGDSTNPDNIRNVPYMFMDKDGNYLMEISAGGDGSGEEKFLATIDNLSNGTARLVGYDFKSDDDKDKVVPITVQSNIGGYNIVTLGPGCFDGIKTNISSLTIEDNSITSIEENALYDAGNLQVVYLPNSLTNIGENAFASCENLKDVYFSSPDQSTSQMTIGKNAFHTGSKFLTFHGIISKDYAPFRYAMGFDDATTAAFGTESGRNICYSTDYPTDNPTNTPSFLKVIRDNDTGKSTLVDYPHLYETTSQIKAQDKAAENKDKNKSSSILKTIVKSIGGNEDDYDFESRTNEHANNNTNWTNEEENILSSIMDVDIVSGIQSFDTKTYFSKKVNESNADYLTNAGVSNASYDRSDLTRGYSSSSSVADLYSTTESANSTEGHAGLFSGLFVEKGLGGIIGDYVSHANAEISTTSLDDVSVYDEDNVWGNDHLTSVVIGDDVDTIPDYAFESCENLTSVKLGANVNNLGTLPFKDCTKLTKVDCSNNRYFECQNGIIYGKSNPESETYDTLVEVLPSRGYYGDLYQENVISVDKDPMLADVNTILDGAFSYCPGVTYVDFKDTGVTIIPVDCFKGDSGLEYINLPEQIIAIQEGALVDTSTGTRNPLSVWIYNPDCEISSKAISTGGNTIKYTFHGYEYTDSTNTRLGSANRYYIANSGVVNFEAIKPGYKVTFINYNGRTLGVITGIEGPNQEVVVSNSIKQNLENDPYPGHVFVYWSWIDDDGNEVTGDAAYNNVSADRVVYARYAIEEYVYTHEPVTLEVVNGTINGSSEPVTVNSEDKVFVEAAKIADKTFVYWNAGTNGEYDSFIQNNAFTSEKITFIAPNPPEDGSSIVLTAVYVDTPESPSGDYVYDHEPVTVNVVNGTLAGSGEMNDDKTSIVINSEKDLYITADTIEGETFVYWSTGDKTLDSFINNIHDAQTTFTVPNAPSDGSAITITAYFIDTPSSSTGGDTSSGDTSGDTSSGDTSSGGTSSGDTSSGGTSSGDTTTTYTVVVNYGSGSGSYAAGDIVNIAAYAPSSSSRVFSKWTSNNSSLGFADSTAATTSFVMPAADVTVTANYKTRSDDDDDDDTSSRRPGSSTTTTTVSSTPNSSSSSTTTSTVSNNGTGTSTSTSNNNGNRIYITKNGVSNTDLASVNVSGSTDNFVVKITESDEANEMAKQALTNTYGSLEGIQYFPMDISLYDSTGQNKITDTYGLNVTVTMPIPDVLIQYGGNARVASTDNGVLTQITPKFTTIDGIACISFVPPHFSPYVIYVDTNNLIAGQMYDSTPKTGDPIHPKWFAAIGMACISVLLFVASDGRKRRKYRTA